MNDFQKWFMDQDFYTNMRFIHGDALFVKDGFVYRVLPVQMTYVAWVGKQSEIDQLKAKNAIKNEKIMKLVSIFTCLSSQILCEEPELSDDFYRKFDEFHSVLINIEL